MNLIDHLNSLAAELFSKHPDVDQGGCCVVAAHVAPLLAEHVPTHVVTENGYWSDGPMNLEDIRQNNKPSTLQDWYTNGVDFHHVLLEFKYKGKWYTFDSTEGVTKRDEYWKSAELRNDGTFAFHEARKFADTPEWNLTFNRKEIPTIRGRITKAFKKFNSK